MGHVSWFPRRYNDIDLATKSKSSLEHRQREEARIRREASEKWETKVFNLRQSALALRGCIKIARITYF